MKLRMIALAYTILVLLTGLVFWNRIETKTEFPIDMLELNTKVTEITEKLTSIRSSAEELDEASIEELEKEYNCDIALISDKNYESVNNDWIRRGWSVFDYRDGKDIAGKIAFDARNTEYRSMVNKQRTQLVTVLCAAYLLGMILLLLIWYFYIRPFTKLRTFAAQVSKGNLDMPLEMTKHNYFGAFTESFDRMREKLKESAERENRANRSKQELVAELSHDIKTPVATIKATCEVMELKHKDSDVQEKVAVIKSKADSVEHLVDNMFKATLEELEELKVEPKEESSLIISDMLSDLRYYGEVKQEGEVPQCLILVDKLRLEQVIDNIAGNSFKYAGTPLEVSFSTEEEHIHVILSDRGPGVPEDELDMLTAKFYRGSVATESGKDGSGLGLYLASIFMERMGGGLEVRNREGGGFVVEIVLKKV
ncbi:MAG: HAMP domain-containing histidine kinase [Clostridiales bacterium]|nr:HAMP domain-containing histidine kinase [Clostridiales bacterium]